MDSQKILSAGTGAVMQVLDGSLGAWEGKTKVSLSLGFCDDMPLTAKFIVVFRFLQDVVHFSSTSCRWILSFRFVINSS